MDVEWTVKYSLIYALKAGFIPPDLIRPPYPGERFRSKFGGNLIVSREDITAEEVAITAVVSVLRHKTALLEWIRDGDAPVGECAKTWLIIHEPAHLAKTFDVNVKWTPHLDDNIGLAEVDPPTD